MKLCLLILIVLFTAWVCPAVPQRAGRALSKDEVMTLVKFGMSRADLAKKIKDLGIDFEPTEDYLQALHQAGAPDDVLQALRNVRPAPLTQDQLGKLVAGGIPNERAAALVQQRGVDFQADDEYLKTLRLAGADDTLIEAVRAASAAVLGQLIITTSPHAAVSLDGESQGNADEQGTLAVRALLGTHNLKVTLAGQRDFEQSVRLTGIQPLRVEARLESAAAKVAPSTGSAPTLTGTVWVGTDIDGQYEYRFLEGGTLGYKTRTGYFTNGTWRQNGNSIYMETNHKYSERQGTISGNQMAGRGWNIKGKQWTWQAERKQ